MASQNRRAESNIPLAASAANDDWGAQLLRDGYADLCSTIALWTPPEAGIYSNTLVRPLQHKSEPGLPDSDVYLQERLAVSRFALNPHILCLGTVPLQRRLCRRTLLLRMLMMSILLWNSSFLCIPVRCKGRLPGLQKVSWLSLSGLYRYTCLTVVTVVHHSVSTSIQSAWQYYTPWMRVPVLGCPAPDSTATPRGIIIGRFSWGHQSAIKTTATETFGRCTV